MLSHFQKIVLPVIAFSCLVPISATHAENSISAWRDDPLQIDIKFERQTSAFNQPKFNSNWMSEFDNLTLSPRNTKYSLDTKVIRQYDATISRPFQRGKFNFGLGLNIKFINGVTESEDKVGVISSQSYNATLPMMYGTALYDLPWKGLAAGVEAKHMVYDSSTAYDYKAMFSYQSQTGFGLNGGWQYKSLNLDKYQNITTSTETDGPFVDVFYNF